MRHARWASFFVCLGLVCACGPASQPTPPPDAGKAAPAAAPGGGKPNATVVLADVGGKCTKSSSSGPIATAKGHQVQWFIQNNCSAAVHIYLKNFKIKETTTDFMPFVHEPQDCTAEPGFQCTPIPTGVVKDEKPGPDGHFWVITYDIYNGTDKIDPEMVIEWP